jgi:hypothetical protein
VSSIRALSLFSSSRTNRPGIAASASELARFVVTRRDQVEARTMTSVSAIHAKRGAPLNWVLVGDVLVTFAQPGRLTDELFGAFMSQMRQAQWRCCLGSATGAIQISSSQRSQFAAEFRSKRTAVLSDHTVSRGVVTALSWLGMDIKAWKWSEVDSALDFLEVLHPQIRSLTIANLEGLRTRAS